MKNRPITAKYDMRLRTKVQDFLSGSGPIGAQMPSKLIQSFDADAMAKNIVSYSGDGTIVTDKEFAYHAASCLKISMIDGDSGVLTVTPTAPIDLRSLYETKQEFARVIRTGESADAEKRLFFVLNGMVRGMSGGAGSFIRVFLKLWSGTGYANMSNPGTMVFGPATGSGNMWIKQQLDLTTNNFNYNGGFDDDSWGNITKIEITCICSDAAAETIYFYMQDAFIALPYYSIDNIMAGPVNAYYPVVQESNNAIYMSRLFGNDSNNGLTRGAPVATIEGALAAMTGSTSFICVLDSAIYTPLSASSAGIVGAIPYPVTIVADYLETPLISARAGLADVFNVGARTTGRTAFWQGGGTKYVVKQDGSGPGGYTTITAALAVASGGDCIEIQDNASYNEYITLSKGVVIQAAAGYVPTWQHASDDIILKINTGNVKIYGVKFQGHTSVNSAWSIENANNGIIKDCSFTGFTDTASNNSAIIGDTGTQATTIDSCLFSDNGEAVKCIDYPISAASGPKTVSNCRGLMSGVTADNIFLTTYYVGAGDVSIYFINNQVYSSSDNSPGACIYIGIGTTPSVSIIAHYNDTNMQMYLFDGTNSIGVYAEYNYIHDNVSMTGITAERCNIVNIKNNYFKNLDKGVRGGNHTTEHVQSNIFYRCNTGIDIGNDLGVGSVFYDQYNIFVECDVAYTMFTSFAFVGNLVMVNCTQGIVHTGPAATHIINCIRYNSPCANTGTGTLTDGTGIIDGINPNFRNPFLDDFSWDPTSIMESVPSIIIDGLNAFINPTTNILNFRYMSFEGPVIGKTCASDSVSLALQQCTVSGGQIGLNETNFKITEAGVLLLNGGIGARLKLPSTHTNVIAKGNNTGILLRGSTSLINVTCTENGWGVAAPAFGYFTQSGSLTATLLNCAFVKNTVYDYGLNTVPQNCVFYSSYYNVAGAPFDSQLLDPDYLYPAIRRIGYDKDSGVYKMSTVPGENIGARNTNYISSDLEGQDYTFLFVGAIDDLDVEDPDWNPEFMALENPQNVDHDLIAVAANPVTRLDGMYLAKPSSYPREVTLRWSAPDQQAKISAGKQALEAMFKSFWVIALSFDLDKDGNNTYWSYYKVKKETPLHFDQHGYYHDWQGWGSTQLKLVQLENFNIVDYVGC